MAQPESNKPSVTQEEMATGLRKLGRMRVVYASMWLGMAPLSVLVAVLGMPNWTVKAVLLACVAAIVIVGIVYATYPCPACRKSFITHGGPPWQDDREESGMHP